MILLLIITICLIPFNIGDATPQVYVNFYDIEKHIQLEKEQRNLEQYILFKEKLAEVESSGLYDAISRSGTYLGKYQFGPSALEDIGVYVDKEYLLNNYKLQETALFKYLRKNQQYLKDEIDRYNKSYINGYYITESGLLAAAHLVGAGAVKRFLRSNCTIIAMDGNGTPLTKYLELFQYEFELNENIENYISQNYDRI